MRIVELVSSLPLRGRAYATGFQFSVRGPRLAVFVVVIALLSARPIPSTATALRIDTQSEASFDSNASRPAAPARGYNCVVGEIRKSTESDEGLKQAIREAIDFLEKCQACHRFYGGAATIERLKELSRTNKIVLTYNFPSAFKKVGDTWQASEFGKFGRWEVANAVEMYPPRKSGEFLMPCVYVNADSFVSKDAGPLYYPYNGLTFRQARGILILHELGHVVDVIPRDSRGKLSVWKSILNTLCIRKVCVLCAEHDPACFHEPAPDWFINNLKKTRKKLPAKRN